MFKTFKRLFRFVEDLLDRAAAICGLALLAGLVMVISYLSLTLFIIVVAVCFWRLRSRANVDDTHGSAHWATLSDLIHGQCVFQSRSVGLGELCSRGGGVSRALQLYALLCFPLRRSSEAMVIASQLGSKPRPVELFLPDHVPHYAVYGASGAGKSVSYAIPMAFRSPENMVILDAKGEIAKLTARIRAREFGHEIVIIDPFGVAEGCGFEKSRFNPPLLLREDRSRLVDEARRLANALIVATGEEKDPFWNKAGQAVTTGVLSFLMAEAEPQHANLNRLRDIITNPNLMDEVLTHMARSQACGGLLARMAGQISGLKGQTKASVYSVINSHLNFLDSLPIAETLSESTFNARKLIHGKMSIYLCLPVDRVTELAGLQRVIVSSLINLVFGAGEDRHRHVRFLLDEAATLGSMDSLYNALVFGRSFGIRLSFYFQACSQVERCFPDSQAADFRATVGSVYCGVNDHASAKEVSDYIGQTTIVGHTFQTGSNEGGGNSASMTDTSYSHNSGTSASTSFNQVARALIQPEEVLQLPRDSAIILLPNIRPILAKKIPYFVKKQRRLGTRTANVVSNTAVILFAASCFAITVWAFTAGRDHPSVLEVKQAWASMIHGL